MPAASVHDERCTCHPPDVFGSRPVSTPLTVSAPPADDLSPAFTVRLPAYPTYRTIDTTASYAAGSETSLPEAVLARAVAADLVRAREDRISCRRAPILQVTGHIAAAHVCMSIRHRQGGRNFEHLQTGNAALPYDRAVVQIQVLEVGEAPSNSFDGGRDARVDRTHECLILDVEFASPRAVPILYVVTPLRISRPASDGRRAAATGRSGRRHDTATAAPAAEGDAARARRPRVVECTRGRAVKHSGSGPSVRSQRDRGAVLARAGAPSPRRELALSVRLYRVSEGAASVHVSYEVFDTDKDEGTSTICQSSSPLFHTTGPSRWRLVMLRAISRDRSTAPSRPHA